MSLLSNLAAPQDANIQGEEDRLGGGGFVWDSGIHLVTVDLAYLQKSGSGATGLFLVLKGEDKRELKQTLWMTSGTEKGCKTYFEKDGEKRYLPGFLHADALALLTVGKHIHELATEMKTLKLYNSDAKAEVPTQVEVVTELLGKEVLVGLIKQIVDKTTKTPQGYVPTGETREENEIDKIFRARDRMTTVEILARKTEPEFHDAWKEKWTGQVKNRAKGANGAAGAPRPTPTAAGSKPTTSLFG